MSDAAPERIWAGINRQNEWNYSLWYDFNFGSDCEEYLRLDLHTAALAARDARIAALEAALTPNAVTKAAYSGEFFLRVADYDEDGEETTRRVMVPWTTIKEIMSEISARALQDGGKP